jgi:hypothetical protein
MQQFSPIEFAIPTRVASSFDHPDWIFKVEAAMPKRSRRWPAKPVLVGFPPLLPFSFEIEPRHALRQCAINRASGVPRACPGSSGTSVLMIYELADSAEALAKALRQGSSPSPTLPTVLT